MIKTKLEEIMEEVIPVLDGITDELVCYELTKEQYEWFLVEASKKQELEERVKELERIEHELEIHINTIETQNQRYKQALGYLEKRIEVAINDLVCGRSKTAQSVLQSTLFNNFGDKRTLEEIALIGKKFTKTEAETGSGWF